MLRVAALPERAVKLQWLGRTLPRTFRGSKKSG